MILNKTPGDKMGRQTLLEKFRFYVAKWAFSLFIAASYCTCEEYWEAIYFEESHIRGQTAKFNEARKTDTLTLNEKVR